MTTWRKNLGLSYPWIKTFKDNQMQNYSLYEVPVPDDIFPMTNWRRTNSFVWLTTFDKPNKMMTTSNISVWQPEFLNVWCFSSRQGWAIALFRKFALFSLIFAHLLFSKERLHNRSFEKSDKKSDRTITLLKRVKMCDERMYEYAIALPW